ncbi:hypothetical protein T4B_1239 [Trichinella pseudospiralis]|uniref:Uncharacterized protein n=1 Tax=Trichinella pseudospiralis TaxID=6337 RepID=A0A0V1GGL3_TRIPS|nr:hypothetical protein T4B_1239 [Trichinella pseudospiralis]
MSLSVIGLLFNNANTQGRLIPNYSTVWGGSLQHTIIH